MTKYGQPEHGRREIDAPAANAAAPNVSRMLTTAVPAATDKVLGETGRLSIRTTLILRLAYMLHLLAWI